MAVGTALVAGLKESESLEGFRTICLSAFRFVPERIILRMIAKTTIPIAVKKRYPIADSVSEQSAFPCKHKRHRDLGLKDQSGAFSHPLLRTGKP